MSNADAFGRSRASAIDTAVAENKLASHGVTAPIASHRSCGAAAKSRTKQLKEFER